MDRILKVYKINTDQWELKNKYIYLDKIQFIIDKHKIHNNDDNTGVEVPHLYYKGLHFHLYNFKSESEESQWSQFFPDYFSMRCQFLIHTFSFVMFIHNNTEMFALIGGRGAFAIKRYLDINFGLDILSRIIIPEKDNVHLAELRGITGNVAGRSEAYREDQKMIDIDSFGKVFKKVKFEIDNNALLEKFHLNTILLRKNKIFAVSSEAFSLRIALDFDQLCTFIVDCINLLGEPEKFTVATFSPITDNELIQKSINIQLFRTLQQRLLVEEIRRGELFFFDYDLCHPSKIMEFYECDKYQLYGKRENDPYIEIEDKNNLLEFALNYGKEIIDANSLKEVMSYLGGLKVRGIKDGTVLTHAPLLEHISCEINHRGKSVYKIDGQWYSIRGHFIEDLNRKCHSIFSAFGRNDLLPEVWVNPGQEGYDEDWYNTLYFGYGDYIVLDKVLSQNIEICDLLLDTNNEIFLIHVKKGFNGMMRDLTNQVRVSARRLWTDIKTENKLFLNGVFDSLEKKVNHDHCGNISREDFISLFTDKKINFVIAFCSTNKTGRRVFSDIETFSSNIAKYSLTEAVREMRNEDYGIYVSEIEHRFQ